MRRHILVLFAIVVLSGCHRGNGSTTSPSDPQPEPEACVADPQDDPALLALVSNGSCPYEPRADAGLTLIRAGRDQQLVAALEGLAAEDCQSLIHVLYPSLEAFYREPPQGFETLTASGEEDAPFPSDSMVRAKDALCDLLPLAAPQDRALMTELLLDWLGEFTVHYLLGRYNIAIVAEKVGPRSAKVLAAQISEEDTPSVVSKIAELVALHGDESTKADASKRLVDVAQNQPTPVSPLLFRAMTKLCGEPVRRFAVGLGGAPATNIEDRRAALECVVFGREEGCAPGCGQPADIEQLRALSKTSNLAPEAAQLLLKSLQ